MRQALHIFAKDVRLFWIEIAATLTVATLFVWVYPSSWADPWNRLPVWPWVPGALAALMPVSWLVLMTRVIHAESLVGERQFWITRPYRWPELMAAKALFIFIFVYVPFFVTQCLLLRSASMHPFAYISGLLFNLLLTTGIIVLPSACLAAVTSNFGKMLLGLLAVVLFAAGTAYISDLLPSSSSTGPLGDELSFIGPVSVFIAVLVIQYARRATMLARTLLVGVAVTLAVAALFGPEDTMMRITYPVRSDASPMQLSLAPVTASKSGFNAYPGDERQIALMFPVKISDIPPETAEKIDNARVSITGAAGERWTSHWQGQYQTWLPGQTEGSLSMKVPLPFYERLKDKPLSVEFSLAVTDLRSGKITRMALSNGRFQIPGGSVCKQRVESWSDGLTCLSPLRQPQLMMVTTRLSREKCSATSPANDGDLSVGWLGNLDTQPADFGITSVWETSSFTQRFSDAASMEAQYLCKGSPITFVAYQEVSKRQLKLVGQLSNPESLAPSQF